MSVPFAAQLRSYRIAAGLSQRALALAAGVVPSYINHIEAGKRVRVSRDTVMAVARACELNEHDTDSLLMSNGLSPEHAATSVQPMPTAGRLNVTHVARGAFLEMLAEREQKGIETYGVSLQTWNGRDAFRDALEEITDAFQYVMQAMLENQDLRAENERLRALLRANGISEAQKP